MIGAEPFDQFITAHRWAVLTTLRPEGAPSSSMVAYARQGDELVVSTRAAFYKVRAIDRDPRVALTIVSNGEPFDFVTVEGTAVVEREGIRAATEAVFANLAQANYPAPADLDRWMASQGRVILRVTPARVYGVIRS